MGIRRGGRKQAGEHIDNPPKGHSDHQPIAAFDHIVSVFIVHPGYLSESLTVIKPVDRKKK